MATYNGERFLREQLDSILNQTYQNFEIAISDDASTDKTISIIEEYSKKDGRIIFSKNSSTMGYIKNFERAILMCKGEIIFLCDQDDIWYADKIERHMKVYENKNAKWAYNEVRLIDDQGKNIGLMTDADKNYYNVKGLFYRTGGRCIIGCATSYRAKSLKKFWPISEYAPGHDSYMQLVLYPDKGVRIKNILQDYRQHENNRFGMFTKRKNNINDDVEKSIKYVKELYKNKNFPIWKRIYLFIIYCGKVFKHKFKCRYNIEYYQK